MEKCHGLWMSRQQKVIYLVWDKLRLANPFFKTIVGVCITLICYSNCHCLSFVLRVIFRERVASTECRFNNTIVGRRSKTVCRSPRKYQSQHDQVIRLSNELAVMLVRRLNFWLDNNFYSRQPIRPSISLPVDCVLRSQPSEPNIEYMAKLWWSGSWFEQSNFMRTEQ